MATKKKLVFKSALQLVILVERMLELNERFEKVLFGSGERYTPGVQRLFSRVSDKQLDMLEKRVQKVQRNKAPIALVEHDILTIIHAEQDARDIKSKPKVAKPKIKRDETDDPQESCCDGLYGDEPVPEDDEGGEDDEDSLAGYP